MGAGFADRFTVSFAGFGVSAVGHSLVGSGQGRPPKGLVGSSGIGASLSSTKKTRISLKAHGRVDSGSEMVRELENGITRQRRGWAFQITLIVILAEVR